MMWNNSLYGNFRTRKFTDIYPSASDFLNDYKNVGIPTSVNETTAQMIYYLLYANYGNSHIASSDENQFKYKLFSLIWQYAPNWYRKREIQDELRTLTQDELLTGNTQIYNTANNPEVEPGTQTLEELPYINNQNTAKSKKGKLEGLTALYEVLSRDVTKEFLNQFKVLFLSIVQPELPLWYITETEEEN